MQVYFVWRGLTGAKASENDINRWFKEEKGWGSVQYIMEWNTLAGKGGEGGRTDVLFKLTTDNVGKFAVQRFQYFSWLDDYLDNDGSIVPSGVKDKLNNFLNIDKLEGKNENKNEIVNDAVVSKDEVQRYEDVRQSGSTNMFMVSNVQALSGLSKDKIMYIMKHYSELIKRYGIERS